MSYVESNGTEFWNVRLKKVGNKKVKPYFRATSQLFPWRVERKPRNCVTIIVPYTSTLTRDLLNKKQSLKGGVGGKPILFPVIGHKPPLPRPYFTYPIVFPSHFFLCNLLL
jgi:hypothetical protein